MPTTTVYKKKSITQIKKWDRLTLRKKDYVEKIRAPGRSSTNGRTLRKQAMSRGRERNKHLGKSRGSEWDKNFLPTAPRQADCTGKVLLKRVAGGEYREKVSHCRDWFWLMCGVDGCKKGQGEEGKCGNQPPIHNHASLANMLVNKSRGGGDKGSETPNVERTHSGAREERKPNKTQRWV